MRLLAAAYILNANVNPDCIIHPDYIERDEKSFNIKLLKKQ
jgi:hypothetical protein